MIDGVDHGGLSLGDVLAGLGVDQAAVDDEAHRGVGVDQLAGLEHHFVEPAVGGLLDAVDGRAAHEAFEVLLDRGFVGRGVGDAGGEEEGGQQRAYEGEFHPGVSRGRACRVSEAAGNGVADQRIA